MCLLVSNLLSAIFGNSMDVVNHMSPVWIAGKPACIVYQFAFTFVSSYQLLTHVLITLNRVWAVTYPFTYRRRHSRKTALITCAVMCTYVHLIQIPDFVINFSSMKLPLEIHGCQEQNPPNKMHQIMIYAAAVTVVITAYPYIAYKRYQYGKTRGKVLPATSYSRNQRVSIKLVQMDGQESSLTGGESTGARLEKKDPEKGGGRAFLVLTLLTCSTTICWTPAVVIFTISSFTNVTNDMTLFGVVLTIFAIQPVLDPLLFTVALQDLRAAFRNLFTCSSA